MNWQPVSSAYHSTDKKDEKDDTMTWILTNNSNLEKVIDKDFDGEMKAAVLSAFRLACRYGFEDHAVAMARHPFYQVANEAPSSPVKMYDLNLQGHKIYLESKMVKKFGSYESVKFGIGVSDDNGLVVKGNKGEYPIICTSVTDYNHSDIEHTQCVFRCKGEFEGIPPNVEVNWATKEKLDRNGFENGSFPQTITWQNTETIDETHHHNRLDSRPHFYQGVTWTLDSIQGHRKTGSASQTLHSELGIAFQNGMNTSKETFTLFLRKTILQFSRLWGAYGFWWLSFAFWFRFLF